MFWMWKISLTHIEPLLHFYYDIKDERNGTVSLLTFNSWKITVISEYHFDFLNGRNDPTSLLKYFDSQQVLNFKIEGNILPQLKFRNYYLTRPWKLFYTETHNSPHIILKVHNW